MKVFYVISICTLLCACTSSRAPMEAPQLPAKHWLEGSYESVQNKVSSSDRQLVGDLYKADKVYTFDDCVYLAVQQSPLLVNSAVDLEIRRLAKLDSQYKYLPELHVTLTVSNNITQYNSGRKDVGNDYGEPAYQIGYYAPFPNPVATYFEVQAQERLINVAIATHRKAIGEAIGQIADLFLRIDAQNKLIASHERYKEQLAKDLTFYKGMADASIGAGSAMDKVRDRLLAAELDIEQAKMERTVLLTQLKMLCGVSIDARLSIRPESVHTVIDGFQGRDLDWQQCWNTTEDNNLLRAQVRLDDTGIMVAWAKYVPNMSFTVNESAPNGQSQPSGGETDRFLHFTFDFPLLDWGHRYREVQMARMRKAQSFQQQQRKKDEYGQKWAELQQREALEQGRLRQMNHAELVAEKECREELINLRHGDSYGLVYAQERLAQKRAQKVMTELSARGARLAWMKHAAKLQERYLGSPTYEAD